MSESKLCYNVKPSAHYFYVKTKILEDFHICISVPLTNEPIFSYRNQSIDLQSKSID